MQNRKVKGIILVAVGIVAMWFTFSPINLFPSAFSFDTENIHVERSVEADAFKNIVIHTRSTDVNVVRSDSEQINVLLQGSASDNAADKLDLNIEPKGDTLELGLNVPGGFLISFNRSNVDLTVELPEKQWNKVVVRTGSGDIDLKKIEGASLEIEAGSGDVQASQIKGEVLVVNTGSGDINITEFEVNKANIMVGSGNITGSDFISQELKFTAGSGDVKLANGQSQLIGETGSGNVRIESDDLLYDADLHAGSGDITVNLSNQPQSLALDYSGSSGEGRIEWDGIAYDENSEDRDRIRGSFGSGNVQLKVRTSSGDFTLGKG
ncbi:DUF4097 family beta strand repeat-containing protein [Paenibacillus abyssi]|uniref:DUF4097 domain-containing protein n=1 Tax=Paenibacillus abyssi TaxID=1340531 RepID=A0A917CPI7_9BACL|nr:DUF4097 family beta strand repeat-containing protein [Paenibacillus abyssi]GGF94921.1 hypothetical protein GCM10010916_10390 [Paenibacillus abyssi]